MKFFAAWLVLAAFVFAQDRTGSIEGSVTDSVSHMPLKKAQVILIGSAPPQAQPRMTGGVFTVREPSTATTDGSGGFAFRDLPPGRYDVQVQHQRYPAGRRMARQTVEVKAGEAARVTVELVPGASISGRVLDPEGDPLSGCFVQPQSPGNPMRGGGGMGFEGSNENGEYRVWGIEAGKYVVAAQCHRPVFEPRPLSAEPPAAPSLAYPAQFYPLASDASSAEIVELAPGVEKTGVDFHMRVARVYTVRGALISTGADWRSRTDLSVMLVPKESGNGRMDGSVGVAVDRVRGTFEAQRVFPGSYVLIASTQGETEGRIGGRRAVEVGDRQVEADLILMPALALNGAVEFEGEKKVPLDQLSVQLMPVEPFGLPPSQAQVKQDGTFTLKSVLPSLWRVQVYAPSAYVKTVSLGDRDTKDGVIDTTAGVAGPLRIVLGTNMATVRGSGAAGQTVYLVRDGQVWAGPTAGVAGANGEVTITNVAPGRYKMYVTDHPGPIPDEGGKEITVAEGETLTVDVKPAQP